MAKAKKSRKVVGFAYMFIGCTLMYTLFSSAMTVFQRQKDIDKLRIQQETLKKEMDTLQNEIELLNNEDYIARYARENYVFTRDGEQVAIIPSDKK